MRRLPALLNRYGISMAVAFFLSSSWFVSIFAAYSFYVNLPALSRSFSLGQSGGMVGLSSYSRQASVDFGCGGPVFGSMSGPVCLWKNPHGRPRFEIPLPVFWEVNEYYCSFGISYWLLGAGCWLGRHCWWSRRTKRFSLEMAALPP